MRFLPQQDSTHAAKAAPTQGLTDTHSQGTVHSRPQRWHLGSYQSPSFLKHTGSKVECMWVRLLRVGKWEIQRNWIWEEWPRPTSLTCGTNTRYSESKPELPRLVFFPVWFKSCIVLVFLSSLLSLVSQKGWVIPNCSSFLCLCLLMVFHRIFLL